SPATRKHARGRLAWPRAFTEEVAGGRGKPPPCNRGQADQAWPAEGGERLTFASSGERFQLPGDAPVVRQRAPRRERDDRHRSARCAPAAAVLCALVRGCADRCGTSTLRAADSLREVGG